MSFFNQTEEVGEIFVDGIETEDEIETIEEEIEDVEPTENQGVDRQLDSEINSGSTTQETRKSSREKKQVEKYGNWTTHLASKQKVEEEKGEAMKLEAMAFQTFVRENAIVPDSFKTARKSKEWPLWRKAIFTEFDSIIENSVFEIIQNDKRDKNKTLINARWVLNKKFDTEGNLKRHKARCVARGFKQKEGIDFEGTFSPTGRLSTMRYVVDYTAKKGIKPRQTDFVTAYLNSILGEEEAVYISIPEGFIEWISETKQETYNLELVRELIESPEAFVRKLGRNCMG